LSLNECYKQKQLQYIASDRGRKTENELKGLRMRQDGVGMGTGGHGDGIQEVWDETGM